MQLRVLVFDDEECIRYMLDSMLTGQGCEVFTFEAPTSFPLYWGEGCVCDSGLCCADILIADIYMPRVSGIQFIENLKKTGCKIPFMALMSGNWTDADLERAKTLDLYIFYKPFTMNELGLWLEQCREKIPQGRVLCDRLLCTGMPARQKPSERRVADRRISCDRLLSTGPAARQTPNERRIADRRSA